MNRIKPFFLMTWMLCGMMAYAQLKAFTVEEKPAEVLEKQVGIGERYALLIGVSKYQNPTINLSFAAADAQALQKLLLDPEIGGFKPENVRLLVNEQASRKNVVSAMNTWLGQRVKPEDSVLIFYSGHGALGNGNEAYWVTYDADVEDLYASAVGNKEISTMIANLAARRKITLIDSCFSEATAKQYKALVPADVMREFKGQGVVTITASTGQEKSVELNGHGAFTFHLLDALAGKADANNNGVVELDEVWNYLSDKVQKTAAEAGNKQTPVLLADRLEHGFPVTINPARAAGATLTSLKQMYTEGIISVEEIGEAERIFTQREGSQDLRKLYRDFAAGSLTPVYFRQLRQVQSQLAANQPATPAPAGPTPEEIQEQQRRESSLWDIARLSDSEKGYDQYLLQFPTGPHAAEARQKKAEIQAAEKQKQMETTAYILAQSSNTEEGWMNFVKQYPTSPLTVLAQTSLEGVRKINSEKENSLYARALQGNTPDDWEEYLKGFPRGRFVEDAMRRKSDAIRRIEEENALKITRGSDSIEGWKAYVEKYPNGTAAAQAKIRIEQLNWIAFADVKVVPAGSFLMGNLKGDNDEKPTHRVEIAAFRIGRAEVTNAQYLKFLEETKRPRPADPGFAKQYMSMHPDLPVVNVTYADAVAFCNWLSDKTGTTVRLPTEAEWEYAALAGHDGAVYPWGSAEPKTRARYGGNNSGNVKTVGRDAFPPNDFGLFNLAGNVEEWVADYYSETAYRNPENKNPSGPPAGKERVIRGGSFKSGEDDLRISRRFRMEPNKTEETVGFRVVVK